MSTHHGMSPEMMNANATRKDVGDTMEKYIKDRMVATPIMDMQQMNLNLTWLATFWNYHLNVAEFYLKSDIEMMFKNVQLFCNEIYWEMDKRDRDYCNSMIVWMIDAMKRYKVQLGDGTIKLDTKMQFDIMLTIVNFDKYLVGVVAMKNLLKRPNRDYGEIMGADY